MVATGAALLLASLIVGGLAPWQDYGQVLSAATRSDLVDVRNVSPAAQLALLVGGDSGLARLIQVPVAALAVLAIGWAAWTRRDPVESLAIAAAATLILLPISWIHYPAAMIPFAAAAVLRTVGADGSVSREIRLAVTASIVVADAALIFLPLMWLAVALCVFAAHRSVPPTAVESDRSPTPAAALAP
jgi:hypothetical protein